MNLLEIQQKHKEVLQVRDNLVYQLGAVMFNHEKMLENKKDLMTKIENANIDVDKVTLDLNKLSLEEKKGEVKDEVKGEVKGEKKDEVK